MVPKVAGKGRSFKGAALYYLHDKGALTTERVVFSHTENLPTRDPDAAIRMMAWTAINAHELKARSGAPATGRKLANPVYTYSLSWAPGQEPTKEQMIAAGRETLRVLGLHEHETLFVSHRDEPHPHLHLIVNRVHPVTGVAAKLSNDHLKLSAWAEEYERQHGQILCEQRVENNRRRKQGEFVKDRKRSQDAEFYKWRRERMREAFERRQAEKSTLDTAHRQQREALFSRKEEMISREREIMREEYRPFWASLYAEQKQERRDAKAAQETVWTRLRYFLHNEARTYFRGEKADRSGFLSAAFKAAVGHNQPFEELDRKHEKQRAGIAARLKRATTDNIRKINDGYKAELAALKERQKQEAQEVARAQAEESKQQAAEVTARRDREHFRDEQRDATWRELRENAKEITARAPQKTNDNAPAKPATPEKDREAARDRRVTERYRAFRALADEITPGKDRPEPERDKHGDRTGNRRQQFRKQADELTRGKSPEPENPRAESKGRLSDRIRAFREAAEGTKEPERSERKDARTPSTFRDNADEITREKGGDKSSDKGRERDIAPKPPKPPEGK